MLTHRGELVRKQLLETKKKLFIFCNKFYLLPFIVCCLFIFNSSSDAFAPGFGDTCAGISAGLDYTCILKSNGNVDCYGHNEYGQSEDYNGGDAICSQQLSPSSGVRSPVYRFWGGTSHFYTISESEKDFVIATWPDIWSYEGPVFYAYPIW